MIYLFATMFNWLTIVAATMFNQLNVHATMFNWLTSKVQQCLTGSTLLYLKESEE